MGHTLCYPVWYGPRRLRACVGYAEGLLVVKRGWPGFKSCFGSLHASSRLRLPELVSTLVKWRHNDTCLMALLKDSKRFFYKVPGRCGGCYIVAGIMVWGCYIVAGIIRIILFLVDLFSLDWVCW